MTTATLSRTRTLHAFGVTPLRLRSRARAVECPAATAPIDMASVAGIFGKRIALAPMREEMDRPALAALYTKIGEAISSLGLQCVRIADAQADAGVRVLAFGDTVLPDAIGRGRVVRVEALAILHADRARKRALWEMLQAFANNAGDA